MANPAAPMANPNTPGPAGPVRPWDQQPAYLTAINRQLAPGQPARYAVPRRQGRTVDDVTDFIAGQANWCKDHLPSILYVLHPPSGWTEFKKTKPADLLDHNGNVVVEQDPPDGKLPRVMRDIPLLPMRIGSQEEEWYYEAVRRLDPRIRWEDITMRMKKKDRASDNCIQWRLSRGWREALGMLSWHLTSNKGNTADEVANNRVKSRLGPWQVNHNTTRGLTPGRRDPRASRDAPGNWIPWPASKGGKDWGKAQTTSFTDKIRKRPGPRKPKEVKASDANTETEDEQPDEEQPEDGEPGDGKPEDGGPEDSGPEDEEPEFGDEESEQPTARDSGYTLPSAPGMAEGRGVHRSRIPDQASRRAPGPLFAAARQQHGLGSRLTQHHLGRATQNGRFGVLHQVHNNHPLSQSPSSTAPATHSSIPLAQDSSTSFGQSYQGVPPNLSRRGTKRQMDELDTEEDLPSQSQAKKARTQPSRANGLGPSFDEIVAGMPSGTTMFLQHKAENPHLYTKEALAERKVRLQRPDMSAAAFKEEMREKYITGRSGYANTKSRSPQESAGGQVVRNAGGVAPYSRRENVKLPGSNQQSRSRTPPQSSTTATAHYAQNSQPNVTASIRAPPNGASIRSVPSVVGTKRNYESLDTDSVPSTSQQVKKARQSSSQDTNVGNLSAEANAAVLKFWNESHAKRPLTATRSSQQALNSAQVNRRQYATPSSSLGSSQAARPVLRNAQGQNIVQPAGQITPMGSEGNASSLRQLMTQSSGPGFRAIPAPGSELGYGAPLTTADQQSHNPQIQSGSAEGYINPTLLNDPAPSGNTQSPAADEIFNLDFFAPSSIGDSLDPDFPASSTMDSQAGVSDEGPMTALLNADDLDFQLPEMGDL